MQVVKPEYPSLDASWLKLYSRTIAPRSVSAKQLEDLKETFRRSKAEKLNDWLAELDEDVKPNGLIVLRWLSKHRSMNKKELELLLAEGGFEEIEKLWPISSIDADRDLKPLISEYACKAPAETFAEAFAFHLTDKKLPAKFQELIEKTISVSKNFLKGN